MAAKLMRCNHYCWVNYPRQVGLLEANRSGISSLYLSVWCW